MQYVEKASIQAERAWQDMEQFMDFVYEVEKLLPKSYLKKAEVVKQIPKLIGKSPSEAVAIILRFVRLYKL